MESHDVSLIIQNIQLVNDNVKQLRYEFNEKIDAAVTKLDEHEKSDKTYWRKIDAQEAQIGLLKVIFSGAVLTSIGASFTDWFATLAHKLGLK